MNTKRARGWSDIVGQESFREEAQADSCPTLDEMISGPTADKWSIILVLEGQQKLVFIFDSKTEADMQMNDFQSQMESSIESVIKIGPDLNGSTWVGSRRHVIGLYTSVINEPMSKIIPVNRDSSPKPPNSYKSL